jgi:hypothetical protein
MESWTNLKHLRADDKIHNWGDPKKLDYFLLLFLDEFCDALKKKIVVTSGYRPGDKKQHGQGKAVDIVVPDWDLPLFDLYLFAERFGFSGIGLYRSWRYAGRECGGLHLDVRTETGSYSPGLMGARWLCVRPGITALNSTEEAMKVQQVYLPFDTDTLRKERFI